MELESEDTTLHRSSSSAASVLLLFVDSHTSISMHAVDCGHQQRISQMSIVSLPLILRWGGMKKKGGIKEKEEKKKKKKKKVTVEVSSQHY